MKAGNSILIKVLVIVLFCSLPLLLLSQGTNTCAENLKNAQSLFDKGQVDLVPGMLRECMKSGFKREELLAAYKLLIQSYLFEDKIEQADSTMLAFLTRYPEYQVSPTDHSSFVFLFNSFKVKPVVKISFHLGTNQPFLTFTSKTSRSLSSEPVPGKYNSEMLNFFGSFEAKFALSPRIEANVEAGLSQLKFTRTEEFLNFGTINYTETQKRLEIPVSITYNIATFGKLTPYARAGIGAALDLGSSSKTSFIPYDPFDSENHTGADISRNNSRIFLDLFAQAGAGIKFKTPLGFASLEARLNAGVFNQVLRNYIYTEGLNHTYYYADDDFNLNTLNICFGYTYIFYKPSKRK
jgi:hypothetical protein